jgi:hypothetical protein
VLVVLRRSWWKGRGVVALRKVLGRGAPRSRSRQGCLSCLRARRRGCREAKTGFNGMCTGLDSAGGLRREAELLEWRKAQRYVASVQEPGHSRGFGDEGSLGSSPLQSAGASARARSRGLLDGREWTSCVVGERVQKHLTRRTAFPCSI